MLFCPEVDSELIFLKLSLSAADSGISVLCPKVEWRKYRPLKFPVEVQIQTSNLYFLLPCLQALNFIAPSPFWKKTTKTAPPKPRFWVLLRKCTRQCLITSSSKGCLWIFTENFQTVKQNKLNSDKEIIFLFPQGAWKLHNIKITLNQSCFKRLTSKQRRRKSLL